MISIGTLTAILRLKDEFSDVLKRAERSLNQAGATAQRIGGQMQSVGASLMPLSLAIGGVGIAAIKMASDAEESENLVRESFQGMTDAATKWSDALSDSLGLNAFEVRKSSASFFLLAENMGQTTESAFDMSKQLTEVAYDLSSFMNLHPEEVMRALQSGLVGNSEALRMLNVFVNEATLKEIAYAKGIAETGKQLTQQQKFQATYAAIMQQTEKAQGDLLRTQDSLTNQLRTVSNQVKQTAIEFGQKLIPVVKDVLLPTVRKLLDWLGDLVDWFGKLPKPIQTAAVVLGGLAAAAGPVLVALGMMVSSIGALLPAITAVAGSLSGVLGPALAIVATLIASYKLTDWILEWTGLREKITAVAEALFRWEKPASSVATEMGALEKASEIAGRTITDLDEAIAVLTEHNTQLRVELGLNTPKMETFGSRTGPVGTIARIAAKAIDSLRLATLGMRIEMQQALPPVQGMTVAEDALARASAITGKEITNVAVAEEVLRLMRTQSTMETITATQKAEELLRARGLLREETDKYASALPPVIDGERELTKQSDVLAMSIEELAHSFQLLGLDVSTALGAITIGIAQIARSLPAIGDFRESILGDDKGDKFARGLGAIAQGIAAVAQATAQGSKAMRALGGAISGAAAGAQIAGPIGAAIGGAIGGIVGLIRGGGPDIARDVARDLGPQISQQLADSIRASGRPVQLAIADIFREGFASGTATADMLAREMGDLFSFFERGEITKPELIAALESAIPMLLERLKELGPAGEEQIQRIIGAAQAMGVEFEGLSELIQGTFAPDTLEEMMEAFDMTNEEVRQLAELLGVDIQTNLERMAASVGLTTEEFKALAEAVKEKYGLEIDQISALLESMGVTAEELAAALGVEVSEGAGSLGTEMENSAAEIAAGADYATRLADELERAARAAGGINISDLPSNPPISAQGGAHGFVTAASQVIVAHRGEEFHVDRPGRMPGGGGGEKSVTVNIPVHVHAAGFVHSPEDVARYAEDGIRELARSGKLGRALQESVN